MYCSRDAGLGDDNRNGWQEREDIYLAADDRSGHGAVPLSRRPLQG